MTPIEPLTTDRLFRHCNVDELPFEHAGELVPIEGFLGQDRAIIALRHGVEIEHDCYHLFALGPTGLGKHAVVQRLLAERARERETPNDWCYVHNFAEPHRPQAIALPVGCSLDLQHALDQLIDELQTALTAAFESDDHSTRRQATEDAAQRQQEEAFEQLQAEAKSKNVALVQTPVGMALAPLRGEDVLKPDEFKLLSEEEQARIKTEVEGLQEKLEALMRQMPQWEREARNDVRQLNREVTTFAVKYLKAGDLSAVDDVRLQGNPAPGRDLAADRPGRAFDRAGDGRHVMEPNTDPRAVEKERFAREIAVVLEGAAQRGRYDRLVLIAPPAFMGLLRRILPASVAKKIDAELTKDLTKLSIHELPEHLTPVLKTA